MTENDRSGREGFLSRWSERKRAVRESEAAEEAAAEAASQPAEEAADEEALAANRAAAEEIDLDSLELGSDMSVFSKPGVPAALRQAAFKKLWCSHPVFACQDGLDIYRENFNDPSYLLKGGASSWVPGSGYAKRLQELKEQAKEALAQAEARAEDAAPNEVTEASDAEAVIEAEEAPAAEPATQAAASEEAEGESQEAEETETAEPEPRVPLRSRLDFAAFKDGQ